MAFTNRVAEYPNRYKLIDENGNEFGIYTLERDEGEITEEGTPLNAESLNAEISDAVEAYTTEQLNSLGVQSGYTTVTPRANQVVTKTVTFPKPYTTAPLVVVTPKTGAPQNVDAAVTAVTTTGFTIALQRNSTTSTGVYWIAMGGLA